MSDPQGLEKLLASVETLDQAKRIIRHSGAVIEYLGERVSSLTGEGTYTVLGPALDYAEKRMKESSGG